MLILTVICILNHTSQGIVQIGNVRQQAGILFSQNLHLNNNGPVENLRKVKIILNDY